MAVDEGRVEEHRAVPTLAHPSRRRLGSRPEIIWLLRAHCVHTLLMRLRLRCNDSRWRCGALLLYAVLIGEPYHLRADLLVTSRGLVPHVAQLLATLVCGQSMLVAYVARLEFLSTVRRLVALDPWLVRVQVVANVRLTSTRIMLAALSRNTLVCV